MEADQEEVGSFSGTEVFTIVNDCPTAIQNVRITHFRRDNSSTEFFITDKMESKASATAEFTSVADKNDNWTVSFALGPEAFMCGKLDKSMQADRSQYRLIIGKAAFVFRYSKNNKDEQASEAVSSVWEFLFNCKTWS